jgi:hypothetical protein
MSEQRCETCWFWERTSESGEYGICTFDWETIRVPEWITLKLHDEEMHCDDGETCEVYEAIEKHEHEENE